MENGGPDDPQGVREGAVSKKDRSVSIRVTTHWFHSRGPEGSDSDTQDYAIKVADQGDMGVAMMAMMTILKEAAAQRPYRTRFDRFISGSAEEIKAEFEEAVVETPMEIAVEQEA